MAENQVSTDSQAKLTLQAARDVAYSLERILKAARHPGTAAQLPAGAMETAERLFNLLDLLTSWLEVVGPGMRDDLALGIDVLRDKALPVGVRLIGQRALRILKRGTRAASGTDGFPVGVSYSLAEAVAGLRTSIDSLGGMENLPDDMRTTIVQAYDIVETLLQMESRNVVFREFTIGMGKDLKPL